MIITKEKLKIKWFRKTCKFELSTALEYKRMKTSKISFDTIWQLLKAFKCKPNDLFKLTR